ncbi:polysaccharide export protein [Roseomonas aerophila]|uniref:Polysaccharide export protein n=1 Tax=Teichococcus aerophilus TaxID=1224513 RepID=A0ABR7RHX7_9PROT|nr:polysaccharide biosynthesis/export family protein [Pseudoroseomonas aerophila]MBC9206166.1 polysaccharide export protein [Pseudoroseomonas aerophila]
MLHSPRCSLTRRMVLCGALLLSACAAPGAGLPLLPEVTPAAYALGAGDQLRVTVFNDPRLTGEFRITDTGTVALPLLGAIPAAGRTTTQFERSVEQLLRERNLFNEPSVAVEVTQYRPVFVLGMVERGGQTPYQPGMSVLSAVAVVGGFNYRAVTDVVSVTRADPGGVPREYLGTRRSLLQPGDVVTVFERRF